MISFKPFCNECSNDEFYCLAHRGIRQHLPASIKLIAVSKQVSVAAMREAYAVEFDLAKVASKKQTGSLQDLPDITWHFIEV